MINISGAWRGSATCVIMLSNVDKFSETRFQLPLPSRTRTIGPCRSTSVVEGRSKGPCQMHSCLISGSRLKGEELGLGKPRSIKYPKSSPAKPRRRLTGFLRGPPWTGCSPRFMEREMDSGPAHNVDCNPPSRARDGTTRPWAVSARRRSAR